MKLNEQHCDLFSRPYFQFAQMKRHYPEEIPAIKAAYKSAWQDWRATVQALAQRLDARFAPPHIEGWCNGWQVRAHFFAYFKYAIYQNSAVIFSLLLNRRRLSLSLEWHAHRAQHSLYTLSAYQSAFEHLNQEHFADFELWRESDGEYADYSRVAQSSIQNLPLQSPQDFYCLGKHLGREELHQHHIILWLQENIKALMPFYEFCHKAINQ